ncbi:MAG: TraB/GumN family protein [Acidobacteriota bacterium]|nr:TraB/GumN family protein [Acidobacteriota bacterium]
MPRLARRTATVAARFLALALLLFSAALCSAQPALYQPGSPIFLWKISSPKNSAYLLGSLHVAQSSFYPLPMEMDRAFNDSDVLVVEVDMTQVDMEKLQKLTFELGTYPAGDDLPRHLKPATVERVKKFCVDSGLPYDSVQHLKPWLISLLVTQNVLNKSGFDAKYGIDLHYLQTPGPHRVDQLETAGEQMRLIAASTTDDADTTLSHLFAHIDRQKEITTRMVDAWGHGEAVKLDELVAELMKDSTPGERQQMRRLNEERNPHMAAHIEECLASSDHCFMVVGALHLVGKEGILSLLQSKGYKIEQVKLAAEKAKEN